jgi:protein transport protein SEC31
MVKLQGAVDCCLEAGMMAEALLLASCGGPDLWARTQAQVRVRDGRSLSSQCLKIQFFAREAPTRPFLTMLAAIIKNELAELVGKWCTRLAHNYF